DRTARSPEHLFSLERGDAPAFVRTIRDVEAALGSPRRSLTDEQVRKRELIRRSAFAARDLEPGTVLTGADLDFRRPGTGIGPTFAARLFGATAARRIPAGKMLAWADVEA